MARREKRKTKLAKKRKKNTEIGPRNRLLIGLSYTFIILLLSTVIWSAIRHFSTGGEIEAWLGLGGFTASDGTFYPTRTLWDWLNLLILPAVLFISFLLLNRKMRNRDSTPPLQQQSHPQQSDVVPRSNDIDKELFAERLREDALQNYYEQMTELLLDRDLRNSQQGSELRALARARTLTTFHALDEERKSAVLRFLIELGLISRQNPIIGLSGVDLRAVQLPHTKLNSIDLNNANMEKANLFHAELKDTLLSKADLRSADLRWAGLAKAVLHGADLSNARLFEADLAGADLSEAKLVKADLSGAILEGANLHRADLREATLTETKFPSADLSYASLIRANLMEANLVLANLQSSNLNKADLRNADLTAADLKRAELVMANLTGILREADLRWAILTEANLSGADLSGANLRDADMTGAILREADMSEVILVGANLTNAILEDAKVSDTKLKMTLSLEGAIMPDGQKYDPNIHLLTGGDKI